MQGKEWDAERSDEGRRVECRKESGMQREGLGAAKRMGCREVDGMQGKRLCAGGRVGCRGGMDAGKRMGRGEAGRTQGGMLHGAAGMTPGLGVGRGRLGQPRPAALRRGTLLPPCGCARPCTHRLPPPQSHPGGHGDRHPWPLQHGWVGSKPLGGHSAPPGLLHPAQPGSGGGCRGSRWMKRRFPQRLLR